MAGLRVLILGLAAVPLFTANATAQDYRLWDQNNDGVITRTEWRGTVQDFRTRDWNRDGVLSGSELSDQDVLGESGRNQRDLREPRPERRRSCNATRMAWESGDVPTR